MTTATDIRQHRTTTGIIGNWLQSPIKSFAIPYAICILAQSPFLVLYFTQLFRLRPHYQFFPFAILFTAVGIYFRWPRTQPFPFRNSRFSDALFIAGCFFGLCAAAFSYAWFSALSCYLFVTSFCARTKDGETGRSMLPLAVPLWVTLALPNNWDFWLITKLQVFSAQAASHVLDLLGLHHHLAGTILTFPERSYGVEEACSGVQSFFTLLFFTSVFIVITHRPWFRALLLMISALFWALLMNSVRILLIPLASNTLGWDLVQPFNHAALGYFVLIVAGLLVLSTDQFLTFVFGPVETTTLDNTSDSVTSVAKFWNRFAAGDPEAVIKVKSKMPSKFARKVLIVGASFMLLLGLLSLGTAYQMLRGGYIVKFFQGSNPVALDKNDLPETIGDWRWVQDSDSVSAYQSTTREAASDFGMRSDQWIYDGGKYNVMVAMDQPFPGWHELTQCYENSGWVPIASGRQYKEAKDKAGNDWPYIQVDFTKPTGEKAYLLFSLFDASGEPFEAPADWGAVNSFLIRVRNRLSPQVRKRLFNAESYQVQAFVPMARTLTDDERKAITENYLELREKVREAFLKRHSVGESPQPTPVSNADAK